MIDQKVLRVFDKAPQIGKIHPIGAQVKNSDRVRAKVLVNIEIVDQNTMDSATAALVSRGSSKVKCRLTLDPTATGVNDASPDAPFRYPSFHDMLDLVSPNCFMALTDIGRYFHTFPLALESRPYFQIEYKRQTYHYARCPFGYKLCPYYCSAWSAEFKQWFRAEGIDTAHMVDDWLTTGHSHQQALAKLRTMEALLVDTGFYLSDKTKLSQAETLLGILVDTRTMTLRFDATQSQGMRIILENQLPRIMSTTDVPDASLVRHICGKLNWFSEILQSGKLHLAQWWKFCRLGMALRPSARELLVEDTRWWIDILKRWEEGNSGHISYPIVNPHQLLAHTNAVYVIQSDASGTDGFGFHGCYLEESPDSFDVHSYAWTSERPAPRSSHAAELIALQEAISWLPCKPLQPRLVVWITDSMSATYSVNKGCSRKDESFPILSKVFQSCDDQRYLLVAVWVPREENMLADFLSHFSYVLRRESIGGVASAATFNSIQELLKGGTETWNEVHHFLQPDGTHAIPSVLRLPGLVHH